VLRTQLHSVRGLIEDHISATIQALPTDEKTQPRPVADFRIGTDLSIGEQIEALRLECKDLTYAKLAELTGIEERQVYRHAKEGVIPQARNLAAYNRVFKQLIGKTIVVYGKS